MYQQQKVNIPISDGGVTVKVIKGTGYVYYTTGRVYSSEEKRSNPVRVTIGKRCEDDPTKMIPNEKYGIYFAERMPEELLVEAKRSSCLHIGAFFVIRKIIAEYKLDQIIEKIVGKDAGLFLDLAAYTIVTENNAAQYYDGYGFNHPLFSRNMRVYSDSKVSDFLQNLSIEQQIEFQNVWNSTRDHREKIYISYDSTNKNCDAGDIDLVEYGHPKDDKGLPVFNYSIAYDTKNSVPLFYETYPGSVVDVQQIQQMIEKAKGYKYEKVGFILDRGYFSKGNIAYLDKSGYNFVIMVKGMKKVVNQLVRSVRGNFEQDRARSIRNHKVSGITVKSPLYPTDTKDRYFHIYYNSRKATTEREELEQKIDRCARYIKKHQGDNVSLDRTMLKYFDPVYYHEGKEDQRLMSAVERTDVINEEIRMCGYFVIITSEKMTAQEALDLYKGRDASEKLFRGDKSYLGNQSMRVYSNESMEAKIFVEFVALIIRNRIYTYLKKEQERSETKQNFLTVPAALRELEKIEMIKLWNKEYCFNYSISAAQRKILKAFDLTPANIRDQAKLLAADLKSIDEGETKVTAAQ
ncbi:MAG: transposase [Solobacterium sp.]|nr:transposase [Solobacterium sp.]